jgi:hypothetical protein
LSAPKLRSQRKCFRVVNPRANGHGVRSFEELVEQLGLDAVAAPKRSTVPLLDDWRQPEPRLHVLEACLGVKPSGQAELHFEYEIPYSAVAASRRTPTS